MAVLRIRGVFQEFRECAGGPPIIVTGKMRREKREKGRRGGEVSGGGGGGGGGVDDERGCGEFATYDVVKGYTIREEDR